MFLFGLVHLFGAPRTVLGQDGPAGVGTISVDVHLVVLHATVRGGDGEFISGLRKENFRIFEDGQPQVIRLFQHEDTPVSVGLAVDNSTSMGRKHRDVAAAAVAFVRSSNPQDEMFVVNFNERVSLGLPAAKSFSSSASELEMALNGVPARGKTALYDAIEEGLAHLKEASREKKVLIVVSDGGDNSSRHKISEVLADAERSSVIIYTVGLFDEHDADQNPGVLKKFAGVTGGEAFFPSDSAGVVPICERIAQDIRRQYTIGYVPTHQVLDDTYRKIKVTATRPHGGKLFVRTRKGYIASSKRMDQSPGEAR
jgi:Ca-activated chloride channel family protein